MRVIFAQPGILLALLFVCYPFVVRTVQPVLLGAERSEEEAAWTLGASRWRTFWQITLPEILPAVLTGALLCFARALGEFGSIVDRGRQHPGKDAHRAGLHLRRDRIPECPRRERGLDRSAGDLVRDAPARGRLQQASEGGSWLTPPGLEAADPREGRTKPRGIELGSSRPSSRYAGILLVGPFVGLLWGAVRAGAEPFWRGSDESGSPARPQADAPPRARRDGDQRRPGHVHGPGARAPRLSREAPAQRARGPAPRHFARHRRVHDHPALRARRMAHAGGVGARDLDGVFDPGNAPRDDVRLAAVRHARARARARADRHRVGVRGLHDGSERVDGLLEDHAPGRSAGASSTESR